MLGICKMMFTRRRYNNFHNGIGASLVTAGTAQRVTAMASATTPQHASDQP